MLYQTKSRMENVVYSCNKCGKVLKIPRPFRQKKKDGFFAGGFRLLLTDGYPVIDNNLGDIDDSEE